MFFKPTMEWVVSTCGTDIDDDATDISCNSYGSFLFYLSLLDLKVCSRKFQSGFYIITLFKWYFLFVKYEINI